MVEFILQVRGKKHRTVLRTSWLSSISFLCTFDIYVLLFGALTNSFHSVPLYLRWTCVLILIISLHNALRTCRCASRTLGFNLKCGFVLFYVHFRSIWLIGHLGKLSWKEANVGSFFRHRSVTISVNRLKSPWNRERLVSSSTECTR
jgi:hypothetical protein